MTDWINGISKPKVYELEDFLDDVKDSRIEALERENARLREALRVTDYFFGLMTGPDDAIATVIHAENKEALA